MSTYFRDGAVQREKREQPRGKGDGDAGGELDGKVRSHYLIFSVLIASTFASDSSDLGGLRDKHVKANTSAASVVAATFAQTAVARVCLFLIASVYPLSTATGASAMAAKPPCAFGAKCYRKNPQHLANFSHPAETEAANTRPTAVNSKAQSEPSPAPSHTKAITKRTAATVDEQMEEKRPDTTASHQPPHGSTGRIKRAKTTVSHTATKQPAQQRHTEDVDQSDDDTDPSFTYQPLTTLNSYSSTQRHDYFTALSQSLYRISLPDELHSFRSFLIALHVRRSGCELCSAEEGVLTEGCVDAVMRVVPAVEGVAGVECCGVLDWLCGRFDDRDRRRVKPWLHWRYFYDLPELMTVYRAVTTAEDEGSDGQQDDEKAVEAVGGGWHCGHWRDAPEDEPPFLVSASNSHPVYTVQGRTIYHALHRHLLQLFNVSNTRDDGSEHSRLIQSTIDQLLSHANSLHIKVTNASGQPQPPLRDKAYLARQKRVLAPTFTGLGFVCPYDPNTQVGFRPLPIEDVKLRSMVERMERERVAGGGTRERVDYAEWDGVVTLLTLAMDECDPGAVLLFYQQIYSCEGPHSDGVRVVEGEVSQGMGSAYEMTGGDGRVLGWKRCIAQQMKYRYRRLLSQIDVAKQAVQHKGKGKQAS